MSVEDSAEIIGQIADKIDGYIAMMRTPLSPQYHVSAFKSSFPDISKQLKQAVIDLTGENPWASGPFALDGEFYDD